MSSIGKIMMASTDAERAYLTDQLTVNMWARQLLTGNSHVVVLVHPDGKEHGFGAAAWSSVVLTAEGAAMLDRVIVAGGRVIDGAKLFTARDAPRKYKAPKE